MKKGKAGLWATIIATGLLATACNVGGIRGERAIFKGDYSIGNLAVSSRDIAWDEDYYKIELKGPEGEQLDITVSQRILMDFKFIDKEGTVYKLGVSRYKDDGAREEKVLFRRETGMGTLTVYDRDTAWASDDYKIELKGDKGILEVIALKGYGLNVRFTDKDGTVYRMDGV